MEETWVRSLGWEDPLEKGIATYSSILAWRITMAVKPGGLQTTESPRVGHYWTTRHTTQREPKSGRKRTAAGDRTPGLVCTVLWSENESLSIMIPKQNGVWKRNRSGLFTPLSPVRELRPVFHLVPAYGAWVQATTGLGGRKLASIVKTLFSNLCLTEKGDPFPLQIRWRSVSHSPHFLAAQHLHPLAHPSPVSLCSCCDTTFHTMANFTCLHCHALSSWSLTFKTGILIPPNCQGNELNATLARSACFLWGTLALSAWPRYRSKHAATCHLGHTCCP